jgi:hypothetical protein
MYNLETLTTQDEDPVLSVSLDCTFVIASLVFSCLHPVLSVSLDCTFVIASLVFSCLHPLQHRMKTRKN